MKSRTVSRPFPGLIAIARRAAGMTESMGPTFGINVKRAAMIPRVPAMGMPRPHNPRVTSVPIEAIDMNCASSHQRRLRTALAAQVARVAR